MTTARATIAHGDNRSHRQLRAVTTERQEIDRATIVRVSVF